MASPTVQDDKAIFIKWVKERPSLSIVFSLICCLLEVCIIIVEEAASASGSKVSKAILMGLAITVSLITLYLIVINAYWNFQKSGAEKITTFCPPVSNEGKFQAWCLYVDGDPYNCIHDAFSIIFSIVQTCFLIRETVIVMRGTKRECHQAMFYPIILSVGELILVTLAYFQYWGVTKIFCERREMFLKLKRMENRSTKTHDCPGCKWADYLGYEDCLLPEEIFGGSVPAGTTMGLEPPPESSASSRNLTTMDNFPSAPTGMSIRTRTLVRCPSAPARMNASS